MLTVVTPATSTALTTVARAAAMLGVPADAALSMAIEAASSMIIDHCRRPFAAETIQETFHRPRIGLLLSRAPVTDLQLVNEAGAALLPSAYELDGELLFRVADACRVSWIGPVSVRYVAGYALPADSGSWTLPAAVERAAMLVVGAILAARERDPMIRSETVEGIGSTSWWVAAEASLPSPEAVTLLNPYLRVMG